MKKGKSALFVLAALVLALASVFAVSAGGQKEQAGGAAPAATGEMVKGGELIYGTWQSPDSLDVQVTGLQITTNVGTQVFDPLLRKAEGDPNLRPGLAERWEVNADSTEFTFYLRKGVKFHDGTPFNARAVKFSLDRLADPATRSVAARGALGPYKGAQVVDDYTVKVSFTQPFAGFLNMCTCVLVNILSPAAAQKWGDQYQFHITGTGPFMLKEYVPDDHVTLVKNPDYAWGPDWMHEGPAYLDTITYKVIPEDLTRVSTLKTGETNLIDSVRSHDLAEIKKNPNLKVAITGVPGAPWILLLNYQKAPTNDLAVRRAIEYAIDRNAMVNLLYQGTNEPAYSPLEKGTLGYSPEIDKIYSYDPAQAKKILDDAGWKVGSEGVRQKGGQRLKLIWVIWTGGAMEEPAAVVQDQLREIGMEVVIETYDVGTAFGKWNSGDLNIAMPFYVWPDPMFLQNWYGSQYIGSTNWAHVNNPELDRLLANAEKSTDPAVRAQAYQKVQKWLMDNAICVPLFGKSLALAMDKNIEGLSYEVIGYPVFYGVHYTK
jgi:peptide/nickel transport system substrate-binding protein